MSRHDFARDPCPWRLVEDMGGAYSMGLVGGGIFHGVKTALKVILPKFSRILPSPILERTQYYANDSNTITQNSGRIRSLGIHFFLI